MLELPANAPLPPELCVSTLLAQAERLGVEVRWQTEGLAGLQGAYVAKPGRPGVILLKATDPPPGPRALCTLLTHEMVHVLQHWRGNLHATPPLGWPTDGVPTGQNQSRQELEAITAEQHPERVIRALKQLEPYRLGD